MKILKGTSSRIRALFAFCHLVLTTTLGNLNSLLAPFYREGEYSLEWLHYFPKATSWLVEESRLKFRRASVQPELPHSPFHAIALLLHPLCLHPFLVPLLHCWVIFSAPNPAGGKYFYSQNITK